MLILIIFVKIYIVILYVGGQLQQWLKILQQGYKNKQKSKSKDCRLMNMIKLVQTSPALQTEKERRIHFLDFYTDTNDVT